MTKNISYGFCLISNLVLHERRNNNYISFGQKQFGGSGYGTQTQNRMSLTCKLFLTFCKHFLICLTKDFFFEKVSLLSRLYCKINFVWTKSHDEKEMTGILLWDLSAAFDTLDHGILCKKLEIYGFQPSTLDWFKSFLSNRNKTMQNIIQCKKTNQKVRNYFAIINNIINIQ